ncbi:MAG: tetratricopeptide repeat protein [Paludibacter sp.]|nr:tetratricopeptide repeat protein [Paludibacter sp.]
MKRFIVFILISFVVIGSNAQNAYQKIIYQAYLNGDMSTWASVIYTIERDNPATLNKKLELLSYIYGYTGYLIGHKKKEDAKIYIGKAKELIKSVLVKWPENPTVYAFKGAFIGFEIGLNHLKSISLAPESSAAIDKCLQLDSKNIQGIIDKANIFYHTPALFGGDKQKSLELYQKAAKLIETQQQADFNWLYLNLLTTIAQNYEALGELQSAHSLYERLLRMEPRFKWVRDKLLPRLEARMG